MTTAFQRLNERKQRPNSRIDFIKAIDNHPNGEDFLNRIAAQCFPVMKKAGINVRSLEEYEPNPEFLGRNFNGGEVIQLVLKDKQGRWLSLNFVQMVMMHELAHCKQMNHSRAFWAVRNDYAKQMEEIWKSGYVGEGIHGRGRDLENGSIVHNRPPDMSQVPEQLCGGTFRKRGRKRKAGGQAVGEQPAKVTYAERQQRRIERKFGKHGEGATVGEDDLLRGALETMNGGKRRQGKPKVAKSQRGRDLCANAALARFAQAKKQPQEPEQMADDSETESEWEDDFVQVCGEDGEENDNNEAGHEMDALRMLSESSTDNRRPPVYKDVERQNDDSETETETESELDEEIPPHTALTRIVGAALAPDEVELLREIDRTKTASETEEDVAIDFISKTASATTCSVCSLENELSSTICAACSNVLRIELVRNHWRCKSETCKGSNYINPGDFGRCGLCSASKPQMLKPKVAASGQGTAVGVTRTEVLRWD